MDRRNFLRKMIGGVAVAAAVRTWPFRVYSFPTVPTRVDMLDMSHWGGYDDYVWYLHPDQKKAFDAIQAIELETLRKHIPELIRRQKVVYHRFLGQETFGLKVSSSAMSLPFKINDKIL